MTSARTAAWLDANRQRLTSELERVRRYVDGQRRGAGQADVEPVLDSAPEPAVALDLLIQAFQLSPFERDILLLCAGIELESGFASLCATAQGDVRRTYPTFSLALAALPGGHWSALGPQAPLRAWRLIAVADGDALVTSRLAIDERVLHFLVGIEAIDSRLEPLLAEPPTDVVLSESQLRQAERLRGLWETNRLAPPVIRLTGDDPGAARGIAGRACAELGLLHLSVRAGDLPTHPAERAGVARLLTREALLRRSALIIEAPPSEGQGAGVNLEGLECPLVVVGDAPVQTSRPTATIEVSRPMATEQPELWRAALGDSVDLPEAELERLTAHFRLRAAEISDAARDTQLAAAGGEPIVQAAWRASRARTRGGLDDLAQRIESSVGWDDLVLPPAQMALLREVASQVRHRGTVHGRWQFGRRDERGLGVSALFAGESGTGKTLAAEVLANDLELDLYRIDLASVVSKYIGETEKNLKAVFDAAQSSGAVLLFDEADALFGKRSEVKDSHDRYANIEVGYLLQRIESYRGLAILTSNMKGLLDTAFLRRIRFVVQFPFPDAALREAIWRQVFPETVPLQAVAFAQLARLNVAGGNIRNIALNAAFLAAAEGDAVAMSHLLHAAQVECAKLEKPLTEAEIGGWR